MSDVFVHPSGQDDNLGDSVLRRGLLEAVRVPGSRLHVHLPGQTSDYTSGLGLTDGDVRHERREDWLAAARRAPRPVYVLNAGEVDLGHGQRFPSSVVAAEVRTTTARRGITIAAGMGVKDPRAASGAVFDRRLREAAIVSWRDHGSRSAAGSGIVTPDWAFALGSSTSDWAPESSRAFLAVTLRFDRPRPDAEWVRTVRALADRTHTSIVTVAQVARDAPRAVELAGVLGGRHLVAASTRHDVVDRHVRSVYGNSVAVVSDRAHALILGATEGACPVGSAADPQKIVRILDAAGLGSLTGTHSGLDGRVEVLPAARAELAAAVDRSRAELTALTTRIRTAITHHS